jgi:endoglucanase
LFLLVAGAAGFVFYNKKKSGAPQPPLSLDVPQDASTSRDQSLSSTPKSVPPKPKLRRVGGTPLERYGMLSVKGNTIVDEEGKPVVLRGMSLFHCMDGKKYYNRECVKWLRDDWKCDVVRIAIMTDFSWPNSWANEPEAVWNRVVTVGDACIEFGLYFIVDYHGGGPPLPHLAQAKKFFKRLAEKYGKTPNLIYETYNEPYGKKGTTLTWSEGVKPYQDAVIGLIRSIDPDNLVMVGTPDFCLHPSHVIADPLKFKNIVYVAHCYAATHKQGLRNDIQKTLDAGYPVFLTEFGTCEYTGSGKLDAVSVSKWIKFMSERKIGWCNWSLHDKDETASALRLRADPKGGWPVNGLRPSGVLIRSYLRSAAKKRAWERR